MSTYLQFFTDDSTLLGMTDLMRIGGVSGWLRAAPVAAAAGIQVSTFSNRQRC